MLLILCRLPLLPLQYLMDTFSYAIVFKGVHFYFRYRCIIIIKHFFIDLPCVSAVCAYVFVCTCVRLYVLWANT